MNRTVFNFLLDALLLLVWMALVWVSCVLRFVFPPGTSARRWTLWGYGYDDWSNVQFQLMALIVLGILLHVMMHWNWVCGVIATRIFRTRARADDGSQTLYGVGVLIGILAILGGCLLAAKLSVQPPVTM